MIVSKQLIHSGFHLVLVCQLALIQSVHRIDRWINIERAHNYCPNKAGNLAVNSLLIWYCKHAMQVDFIGYIVDGGGGCSLEQALL